MNPNRLTKVLALSAAVVIGGMLSAHAQPFSGSTTGTFINPVAGADNPSAVTTGIGTSSMTWGQGPDVNQLNFTGAGFASVPAETQFQVGSMFYYNGTQALGTQIDSITLDLKVAFTAPGGLNETFDFPIGITTTPNTSDPMASADYLTLPPASATTFTVGSDTYTLKLSFDTPTGGGFLASDGTFHVYEEQSSTTKVEGVITTDLSGVPDGGSTMILLGAATGLLGWIRRKQV
jgi:hypothetical protein